MLNDSASRPWRLPIAAITAVTVFNLAFGILSVFAQQAPGKPYVVIEYARLDHPGASAVVRRINSFKEIAVGFEGSDPRKPFAAFILTNAGPQGIFGDTSVDYSVAYGLNDRGEIAGAFNTGTALRPFRAVRNVGFQPLALLPGHTGGVAFGVNDLGEGPPRATRAAAQVRGPCGGHVKGNIAELQSLPGSTATRALALNDRGDIVGTSGEGQKRAVLWPNKGGVVSLVGLPGFASSEAVSISDRGDIAGFATRIDGSATRSRAVLWASGGQSIRDLGTLPGGADSRAQDVNGRDEVVGMSTSSAGNRAFIWTAERGMVDLNTLVLTKAVILTDALSINKDGEIVAIGHDASSSPSHDDHVEHERPRRIVVLTTSP